MATRRFAAILAVVCVLAGVSGCSAGAVPRTDDEQLRPEVPAGGLLLQGAGATFPSILYKEWFRQYGAAHPTAVIAYAAVGSGEGVRRFVGRNIAGDEHVDFGASDAAMTDDERAAAQGGAVLVPATAGQIAIAYNLPDLPSPLRLSRLALAGIFLGEITRWNDQRVAAANPGVRLPNLTIATVVRQDGSGTTFAFTNHLDASSSEWHVRYGAATLVDWPGNAMRASGNDGVAARIKQSVGSIGYVGDEFARRLGLRSALLENRSHRFVAPSEESASAALQEVHLPQNMRAYVPDPQGQDAYPIVTLSWILLHRTYADARVATALQDLFRWCLTDGQRRAAALGYVPLPAEIVQRSLAEIDRVTAASAPMTGH